MASNGTVVGKSPSSAKKWTKTLPSAIDPKKLAADPTLIFDIIEKLGEGAFGSVFKARDTRDGTIVAIKEMADSSQSTDLQREIDILKECHSDYIVGYKGTFETKEGKAWIAMEYCGGGSLADIVLICEKTLTEEQVAIVMRSCLHGLAYLHEHKKIHRDIKSGNVLLTQAGECKLADFGVSAQLTDSEGKRRTVIGTPYWMAPEVLMGTDYDFKADIWSLGITAIELSEGLPPHAELRPMQALFKIPLSPPPTFPDPTKYSSEYVDFVRVCLQKDPALRPTARALLTHPFITNASPHKTLIATLVEECIPKIRAYREQQAKEAAAKAGGDLDDNEDDDFAFDTRPGDAKTVVARTTRFGTSSSSVDVSPSATLVVRPTQPATIRFSGVPYATGPVPPHAVAAADTPGVPPQRIGTFRTGEKLTLPAGATPEQLRAHLSHLEAEHRSEAEQLERFYAERKAALQKMIGNAAVAAAPAKST